MALSNASTSTLDIVKFDCLILLMLLHFCPATSDKTIKYNTAKCPLWHVPGLAGQCKCGDSRNINGIVNCIGSFLYIKRGNCMTWNNLTKQAELQSCLFNQWNFDKTCEQYSISDAYRIPANISGRDLDYIMCRGYNRQGPQCRQCVEGYGPTIFTDGTVCADCSKHQYLWILYFIFLSSNPTTCMAPHATTHQHVHNQL